MRRKQKPNKLELNKTNRRKRAKEKAQEAGIDGEMHAFTLRNSIKTQSQKALPAGKISGEKKISRIPL